MNLKSQNSMRFKVLVLLALAGCGTKTGLSESVSYSLDGVKVVSPAITSDSDPASFLQYRYSVSSQSRVLLRLENFSNKEPNVVTAQPITVEIEVESSADVATAQASFSLCPITKNWMMLATWYRAYPMGSSGAWSSAGVDYDAISCISAPTVTGQLLTFNVASWFANDVRGRQRNYGLVLISSTAQSISIYGDQAGSHTPKLRFTQSSTF